MAQYKVSITPVRDDGASDDASRTTMWVCVDGGHVYIKELTVRVADDVKAGAGDLIQVDLDMLMRAFAPKENGSGSAVPGLGGARPQSAPAPAPATAKTGRAYRRMPDPNDVKNTYLRSRTITGVAAHYGVPTHTAQGWISRLRRKGVIPTDLPSGNTSS